MAFLILALASSSLVARALQAQVDQFLSAARRLASGDFEHPVPVVGDDQFAQLGREFNRMSDQVRGQIAEVERRRRQTERTIRRVGTAFASGLDSQAVIDLTVQTAAEACAAEVGFAMPFGHSVFHKVTHGEVTTAHQAAPQAAERAALAVQPGTGRERIDGTDDDGKVKQPGRVRGSGVDCTARHAVQLRRRRAAGVLDRSGGHLAGERSAAPDG